MPTGHFALLPYECFSRFFQRGNALFQRLDDAFGIGLLLTLQLYDCGGGVVDKLLVAEFLQHALQEAYNSISYRKKFLLSYRSLFGYIVKYCYYKNLDHRKFLPIE